MENNKAALWEEFWARCEEIADDCVAEGYPLYGGNYELRVKRLQQSYPELFEEEDFEEEEEWYPY